MEIQKNNITTHNNITTEDETMELDLQEEETVAAMEGVEEEEDNNSPYLK